MIEKEDVCLKIVTRIIILILILICLSIILRMVSKNVLVDMLGIDNNITRLLTYEENVRDIKHIDWQQIYPFEEESQEENKEIDIKKLNDS